MENLSIFKNIDSEDINKMLKCFETRTSKFKKGSTILSFIGNNSMVGIILEGEAALIRYDYSGNKTLIEQLGPNSMFGERFSNYNADELLVEATKDCTVLFMDFYHITKRCKKACNYHSTLVENVLEILANKVILANERAEILAKKSIRDKLLAYFEMTSKRKLSKSFTLPLSYTDLADYLGIDRSAMQRELKNLKEDEFIKTKGKQITLLY